jgi:hypothetical protein
MAYVTYWLLRNSETLTNALDLLSFLLVTPEVVGWARLKTLIDAPRLWLGNALKVEFEIWQGRVTLILVFAVIGSIGYSLLTEPYVAFKIGGAVQDSPPDLGDLGDPAFSFPYTGSRGALYCDGTTL